MHKRLALILALLVLSFVRPAEAAKPEDVFKGKIIITKNRLPMKFSSQGAFVSALQKGRIDKIWPSEEKGDTGKWNIEYIAFFAQPLDDSEIQVKFYDITAGEKKFVAGDPQMTRERGSRIFGASIEPTRVPHRQMIATDRATARVSRIRTSSWYC